MASWGGRNSRSGLFSCGVGGRLHGGLFVLRSRLRGTSGVAVIPLSVGVGGLETRRSVGTLGLRQPPSGLGRGVILRGGLR